MNKLLYVLVSFFVITLLSGCASQRSDTIRFDQDGTEITNEKDVKIEAKETNDLDKLKEENKMEEGVQKEKLKMEAKENTEEKVIVSKLAVTSLEAASLKTSLNYNLIEGSVSSDVHNIKVNDYSLQKFIPGQKIWSFVAATNYGTLKNGWNDYVVKTYDVKGKELKSLIFSIEYNGVDAPSLPGVGSSLWLSLLMAVSMSFSYLLIRRYMVL